jgi:hypothetical protein
MPLCGRNTWTSTVESKEAGSHFDTEKPRVDLIPSELIFGAGRALKYGADKYGEDNFREGIRSRRLVGSLLRHVFKWLDGEDVDQESGLDHLDHAAASLGMLMFMLANRPDLDDRWCLRASEELNCGIREPASYRR